MSKDRFFSKFGNFKDTRDPRKERSFSNILINHTGTAWKNRATSREEWGRLGNDYVQRWTEEG